MARLTKIEGIGEVYAQKLAQARIGSTQALLERAATPQGRAEIAKEAGVTEHQILEWANQADLMRVPGIGAEYADLLEAAGVDTVRELAQRNAENLHAKLKEVNAAHHLTRRVPGVSRIRAWIETAESLPCAIEY
ncbi:MAG: DUF4332 domain-containing protein [Anaerolineae bacterium]